MVWQSEQGPLTIAMAGAVNIRQEEMIMIKIIIYFTIPPAGSVNKE